MIVLHLSERWREAIEFVAWGIAAVWCFRTYDTMQGLPRIADLRMPEWDVEPQGAATLTVIVPARDEAANIAPTLEALAACDSALVKVLAVDDRSTDTTGAIMDQYAAMYPARIAVVHVTELPEGWLGKTFAMEVAAAQSSSEYLLFTDADVLFSPSILRRALVFAEATEADHLVVLPTMLVKSRGEGIVLGFFQVLGSWASRLWRVEEPGSRDVIGVGAFNMVRRAAFEELGGWAPQRLAVLEDITLGRRMKAARMRQRVAFAPGFVLVHWAKGARGLIGVMRKNLFSAFNFRPLLMAGACGWIVVFCLLPLLGLGWWGTLLPSVIVLGCMGATYRVMGEVSGIDARYGWLYPLGAGAFLWAMAVSMVTVWGHGGVRWRGTHYPLRDLRRHNSPFQWEMAAARERRVAKGRRDSD